MNPFAAGPFAVFDEAGQRRGRRIKGIAFLGRCVVGRGGVVGWVGVHRG